MAALGLHCCAQAFSSCSEQGLLTVVVPGFLTGVASLAAEHGVLGTWASAVAAHRLSSCGTQTQLTQGMRNLPGPGIEPMSPTLADGFLYTVPSEKSMLYMTFTDYLSKQNSFIKLITTQFCMMSFHKARWHCHEVSPPSCCRQARMPHLQGAGHVKCLSWGLREVG